MTFLRSLTLLFLLSCPLLASPDFESRLEALRQKTGARAVLAGVWKGGEAVNLAAVGESMAGVPATPDMHLRIGGVSETFLGTLVLKLVEEGRLSLDDPVSKYLPDLLAADRVTVGMLMKSLSGYKDYVYEPQFLKLVTAEPFRTFTHEELLDFATEGGQLAFSPGTAQKYSHTDYTVLEDVLEQATGRSMPELYQERLFGPLGLGHTGYMTTPELPLPVLHTFSDDRGVYEESTYWNPSWTGGSGPLYSTLEDLGRWARLFGRGELLSQESFAWQIARPQVAERDDFFIACGFVVADGWFLQNPSFNGFMGGFGYLPSEDLAVIVYATQEEGKPEGNHAFAIFRELVTRFAPQHPINL